MLENNPAPLEGNDTPGLEPEQTDWLALVKEAKRKSTDYLDANYRKQWERNIANFRSTHPPGSKYHTDAYKLRSRRFRPKTRAAQRRAEAAFSEALFATTDVVNVEPMDQTDKGEDKAAEVWQAILNHRLRTSIPWFLTAMGAFQEARIYGVVCSRQDWEYEEAEEEFETIDPLTQAKIAQKQTVVVSDRPRCKLLEIENVRFDPAADWTDPVGTSPYFIELMPMYVGDVLEMMERREDKTGAEAWAKMERGEVLAAGRDQELSNDSTRTSREANNQDPKDSDGRPQEYEIVWVFRNFIKKGNQDYEFYTLTDKAMLTNPKPVKKRPYRIGIANIEAHRAIPSGDVELIQNLQAEANDIANQRLDNIKLALNKGHFVQRDKNVDLLTLKRSYPGRLVMMDDINAVKPDEVNDVTGSAYAEQDRINVDIDDLTGGFSSGSVASNRKLNETVGGMQLMNQSGSSIQGYGARIFVETWIEPVLNDLVGLIQEYESDEIFNKFARKVLQPEEQAPGQPPVQAQPIDRETMKKKMKVGVSVGFGPLDPKARAQLTVQSLEALGKFAPWLVAKVDGRMLSKEIFGVIGYRDGSKLFTEFPNGPPEAAQDPMVEVKMQEVALKKEEIVMRGQIEMARLQQEQEYKLMEMALREKISMQQLYARLDLDMDKLNLNIMQEMGRRQDAAVQREEMSLKRDTGSGV